MKCKKCGKDIAAEIQVDSKDIRVQRTRKHCFECVSFCYKNKRRLEPKENEKLIVCKYCDKQFCSKSGRTYCQSCNANLRRFKLKQKCLDYKGNCCKLCGYNKCSQALAFHHRNPDEKKFQISGSHCRKWEDIQKELDKCDLLCHNCHVEMHNDIKPVVEDYSI